MNKLIIIGMNDLKSQSNDKYHKQPSVPIYTDDESNKMCQHIGKLTFYVVDSNCFIIKKCKKVFIKIRNCTIVDF